MAVAKDKVLETLPAGKVTKPKSNKSKQRNNKNLTVADGKWEKVKLKGHVISDDFAGYEGLIGLEVLNDYDPKTISKARGEKRQKTKAKKGKGAKALDEADGDVAEAQKPLSRKARLAEKKRQQKELREQQKLGRFVRLKPPTLVEDDELSSATDSSDSGSDSDSDEAPELISANAVDIDDLEGWNGIGVPQPVLRALAEHGFKSPTEIQALTLPAAILGKKDILGAAETGSGKTLAFGIPLIAGILELKEKNLRGGIRKAPKVKGQQQQHQQPEHELTPPAEVQPNEFPIEDAVADEDDNEEATPIGGPLYAVVLTPTRELAVQVSKHIIAAAKYTGIQVAAIFGGLSVAKQERLLRKCPEIVVATPGRFWELYQQDNQHLSKLDDISFLVIDETDRMVEKGHFEELRNVLKVINADEHKKQTRQNFIFSATLTLVHDLPDHLQKRNNGKRPRFIKPTSAQKIEGLIEELGISQPKIVDITSSQQTAQTLTESRLICAIDEKDFYLYYFVMRHPGRTIVFCNSIDCVKRLGTLFGLLNCNPLPLHANMAQKQRLKNLERFRDNPTGLLIATDVAARGLDIPNVEHVIHYQVPRTSENYVHRSGRTARANKSGITVMFMEPGEVKSYVKLYKTLERTEDLPLFPIAESYMPAVRQRVNLARELDQLELRQRRQQADVGWMKKHADEMDIIIDGYNDEDASDDDEDPYIIERKRNRNRLEAVRAELKSLLSKQAFPRGFSFHYPGINADNLTSANGTSAVDAVKASVEELRLAKKQRNKRKRPA